MTGLIICCVVLAIVVIYLAIELYFQAKKVTDLTDQNIRLYGEIVRQPTYRIVNKLIFVDFCNLPTTEEQIKQAEEEGYKYNHDKSFETVLCFTKAVEIKDETPAES